VINTQTVGVIVSTLLSGYFLDRHPVSIVLLVLSLIACFGSFLCLGGIGKKKAAAADAP